MFRVDFPSFTYRRMKKGFRLIGFYNNRLFFVSRYDGNQRYDLIELN